MGKVNWNIAELLAVGENVIYECTIEDDDNSQIKVYLTTHRIICINGDFVDSRLYRFISKCGVFVGYDEFNETNDIGVGEYGVYFGETAEYESLWFYSEDVWKTFYSELSRCILEEH